MKANFKNIPDNCTLDFSPENITLRVSLNIENELRPFIAACNTYKGEQMYVYSLYTIINYRELTHKRIQFEYDRLLNKCMTNVREAKVRQLEDQILKLKSKSFQQMLF